MDHWRRSVLKPFFSAEWWKVLWHFFKVTDRFKCTSAVRWCLHTHTSNTRARLRRPHTRIQMHVACMSRALETARVATCWWHLELAHDDINPELIYSATVWQVCSYWQREKLIPVNPQRLGVFRRHVETSTCERHIFRNLPHKRWYFHQHGVWQAFHLGIGFTLWIQLKRPITTQKNDVRDAELSDAN